MRVGITGYDAAWDGKLDFFELDFLLDDPAQVRKSEIVVNLNHSFYRFPHSVPLDERVERIEARIQRRKTLGFVIRLTPRFFETQRLEHEVLPLSRRLRERLELPVWIDLPPERPARMKLDPGFTSDPLWKRPTAGGYWKVHGWHDTRWVRRYSAKELETLARLAKRHEPEYLVFGHSQRSVQVGEFLR